MKTIFFDNEVSCYELSSTFPLYGHLLRLAAMGANEKPGMEAPTNSNAGEGCYQVVNG